MWLAGSPVLAVDSASTERVEQETAHNLFRGLAKEKKEIGVCSGRNQGGHWVGASPHPNQTSLPGSGHWSSVLYCSPGSVTCKPSLFSLGPNHQPPLRIRPSPLSLSPLPSNQPSSPHRPIPSSRVELTIQVAFGRHRAHFDQPHADSRHPTTAAIVAARHPHREGTCAHHSRDARARTCIQSRRLDSLHRDLCRP